MAIIDFHTHLFPEKVAARAIAALAEAGGNLIPYSNGAADSLIDIMDAENVDKSVVLNIATNEKQMKNVNDFAISLNGYRGRLISFGSVFPFGGGAEEELYRLRENGVKGIKFHPEYQEFYVDDSRLAALYETINKLGLITVFHAGQDIGFTESDKSSPARCVEMLKALTGAPVVLAHMGGYIMWFEVERLLTGKNVFFDTSYCYSRIPMPIMERIVKNHGADKILFGTDMPWSLPSSERRLIDALRISDGEKSAILGGNAEKLLNFAEGEYVR
jgi:predicted TIM-barrel fold metal-dependent hydrolase